MKEKVLGNNMYLFKFTQYFENNTVQFRVCRVYDYNYCTVFVIISLHNLYVEEFRQYFEFTNCFLNKSRRF